MGILLLRQAPTSLLLVGARFDNLFYALSN